MTLLKQAKELLVHYMSEHKITNAELARRMRVDPRQITRLLGAETSVRIQCFDDAFHALGLTPTMDFRERAEKTTR